MRKLFIMAIALLCAGSLMAQQEPQSRKELTQQLLKTRYQRDASKQHLTSGIPVSKAPAKGTTAPKSGGLQLPEGAWFPGEWEEVKAIVVTCYYDYFVPGHENDYNWYASPIASGLGLYYNGNSYQGMGPYIAAPATDATAYGDFVNVFFYVMDAIQQGGAEAWVRIENGVDSTLIKNKLTSMNLRTDKLKWIIGPGNSFWFRDCGPIAFYYGDEDSVGMVDFMYYPGRALDDSLPTLIEEQMGIPNYITEIEWEGGNCVVDGAGMVLSSDALLGNNADTTGQLVYDGTSLYYSYKEALTKQQVQDSLAHIMGPRGAHILPAFRYDGGTGHLDLYCDMIDENEFVFSKFPEHYSNWVDYKTAAKNIDTLCSYTSLFDNKFKRHFIPFPCTNNGGYFASQTNYNSNYTRTYSNHTFVNNVLIQPVFSNVVDGEPSAEWDKLRLDTLRAAYPGYTVYPINVRSFDGSGGAIHCITKQIPADNPIRILHPSITGNTGSAYSNSNAPITATITNKSGIASAKVVYRVNGGQWNEVSLSAGSGNNFSGSIPTTSMSTTGESYTTVEYYLSATSNNGKTITKPMTASQGGYYTFYLGHNPAVSIDASETAAFGQFYPNPAEGQANIDITLNADTRYEVLFVDPMGRVAHRSTLQAEGSIRYSVDTTKLQSGSYLVVFQSRDERIVRRLIVK